MYTLQKELKKHFYYNKETGELLRKRLDKRDIRKKHIQSRRIIYFKNKSYLESRLIWLYHYGNLPEYIDHIDRNYKNNKIENLREISRSENSINIKIRSHNISKVTGVSLHSNFKWTANICINKKQKYLGLFNSFNDAVIARYNAEVKYGFIKIMPNSTAKQYLIENNLLK